MVCSPRSSLSSLLRERVVERERQAIDRRELHGELGIGALALEIGERVTDVVRDAVELADRRGVPSCRRLIVGCWRRRNGSAWAAAFGSHGWMCQSLTVRCDGTAVTLLVAGRFRPDTPGLVVVGVAEDAADFGSDVAADTIATCRRAP